MKLDRETIDALWEQGYRPFEVYLKNAERVEYMGLERGPGEITGWEIQHVFARREDLPSLPFFDEVIGTSAVSACEIVWDGETVTIIPEI